jgi:hypothetical protein
LIHNSPIPIKELTIKVIVTKLTLNMIYRDLMFYRIFYSFFQPNEGQVYYPDFDMASSLCN